MGFIVELLLPVLVAGLIYVIYRAFFSQTAPKKSPYEQGFEDAVRYFGLKKLYEEDEQLAARMTKVFDEAGLKKRMEKTAERMRAGKKKE
jgi:hypothetical protein